MELHDFSMVFNDFEIALLNQLLKASNCCMINEMVSSFIRIMHPYLENSLFLNIKGFGSYKKINWTTKMHIKIRQTDYNLLKLVYNNLNASSIAAVIRMILEVIFDYFILYGGRWFFELKKFLDGLIDFNKNRNFRAWDSGEFPETFTYRVDYDKNYQMIHIQNE